MGPLALLGQGITLLRLVMGTLFTGTAIVAQFRLSFYKLYYRTEQTKYIMQLPDGNWTCDKPPSVFKNYNRRKRAHL
jgi:hypothetical protein